MTAIRAAALCFMLVGAPALADDTNFVRCDGYRAPEGKADGMTKANSLWGAGTTDLRKLDAIPLGETGIEGCDGALADARLLPAFWLRRAHLLQAKAVHAVAVGKPHTALELLSESDAVGQVSKSPGLADSLGIGNRAIRAYALTDLGKTGDARQEVRAIADARPWSSSIRRLAAALDMRIDKSLTHQIQILKADVRLAPDNALRVFWLQFIDGNYAEAAAIGRAVSFDLPKLRFGWSIEDEANSPFETIETRANVEGARAYAVAATGDLATSARLIEDARADLAEAAVAPQPGPDGRPPKKSQLLSYQKRLPFVEAGRIQVNLWESAIALRAALPTKSPEEALQAITASNVKLPIFPDILGRIILTTQPDIEGRKAAIARYRAELDQERSKALALPLSDLVRALPRPETPEMTPVLKPAGDGYFLSDSGLSRAREGTSDIWTIRYAHKVAPMQSVEDLSMLGAAQTAISQGKDSLIVLSRRSVVRTTHVSNTFYGVTMSTQDVNSGYEAQVRVAFVNATALPVEFKGMEWRLLRATEIIVALSARYRQSKGLTVAF